jgi:hypothetical protein
MLLVQLAVYALWFVGAAALIMAAIMFLVSSRLRQRSRVASEWPQLACAQVTAEAGPLHLNGLTGPGPQGLLRSRLSRSECIWYGNRVMRNFWVTRWTGDGEGGSVPITEPRQEQVWEWDSGPFSLADSSGSVLIDPVLLRRTSNVFGYPKEQTVGETADDGPEAWHYRGGMIGALQDDGLLPPELLEALADPEARTFGYRVIEEIVLPDLSLHVFAVPAYRDGRAIMRTPYRDLPAISAVEPVPAGQARGSRRATRWAAVIGGAGLACFGLSALLLPMLTD